MSDRSFRREDPFPESFDRRRVARGEQRIIAQHICLRLLRLPLGEQKGWCRTDSFGVRNIYRNLQQPQGENHRSAPNMFRLLGSPIGERKGSCRTDSFGGRDIYRISRQPQGSLGWAKRTIAQHFVLRLLGFPIGERKGWCRTDSVGGKNIYRILRQAQASQAGEGQRIIA